MRRIALAVLATVMLCSVTQPLIAQEEIENILDLLDAVDAAELAVLGGTGLTADELAELERLIRVADTMGAADLAARARSLLVIARPDPERIDAQPDLAESLQPPVDRTLVRGGRTFRNIAYILTATGGTALTLSGVFYALAERDYQRWRTTADPALGDELYQAWRGYDVLSLGMGGTALVSAGVGLPLLYALSQSPASLAAPLGRPVYTTAERATRLLELYSERAEIVGALNELPSRAPRHKLVSTIGLATGLVGTVTSVAMFYVAEEFYQEYLQAPLSADAERLGRRVELFDTLGVLSAGLAAGGFGTSVTVSLFTRDRSELEAALRRTNERIIELRTAPTVEPPQTGGGL